jgi:hypothetical protein
VVVVVVVIFIVVVVSNGGGGYKYSRHGNADECSEVVSGGRRNSESFGREARSVPPEDVGTWRVLGERHIL